MEEDELDKLATETKLGNIGGDEKGDFLDDLYGGGAKSSGYDKGTSYGSGYGPTTQLGATGRSQLDAVMRAFSAAGRSAPGRPQLQPLAPRGQVGQLGQLQLQLASPGRPSQLGPQLCQPRPLMAYAGGSSRSSTRRRSAKKRRRCSCTH